MFMAFSFFTTDYHFGTAEKFYILATSFYKFGRKLCIYKRTIYGGHDDVLVETVSGTDVDEAGGPTYRAPHDTADDAPPFLLVSGQKTRK